MIYYVIIATAVSVAGGDVIDRSSLRSHQFPTLAMCEEARAKPFVEFMERMRMDSVGVARDSYKVVTACVEVREQHS